VVKTAELRDGDHARRAWGLNRPWLRRVSGLTKMSAQRQSVQTLQSQAQKNRSTAVSLARLLAERWSTPIWWWTARFSSCTEARDLSSDERAAAGTGSTLNIE
jgi:hypothetical protein